MSELNTLFILLGIIGMVIFTAYGLIHYRPVKRNDRDYLMYELHGLLTEKTGCASPHTGWCCNPCFHSMALGVTQKRLHELWLSTLMIRGDYSRKEIHQDDATVEANVNHLIELLKLFSIHDGEEY